MIKQALDQISLIEGADHEVIYLTLLAIYILEEAFSEFEEEWFLIAAKAVSYLEKVGIQ